MAVCHETSITEVQQMQLQYDDLETVPEDLRENFVEFKEGDKTVFMHKELAETKKEFYRSKGDLTQAQKAAQEKAERLQALEDAEANRVADKEAAELESKKKNGQHEEILNDFKTKAEQREAELKTQLDELNGSIRNEKKNSVVSDLSALGTDSTRPALKRLIAQDLDFGEDDNLIVIEDGKASSTTVEEYKAKLKDLYPSLTSGSHGSGGLGKGGTGSVGALGSKNQAAEDAKKKGDLNGYLSQALKF